MPKVFADISQTFLTQNNTDVRFSAFLSFLWPTNQLTVSDDYTRHRLFLATRFKQAIIFRCNSEVVKGCDNGRCEIGLSRSPRGAS